MEPAEEPLPSASSRPELDRAPVQPVIEPERGLAEPAELERELAELAELERGLSELAELEQRVDAGTPPLRPAEPSSEPLTSQPEQTSELCEFFESQSPVMPTEPLMSVPLKNATAASKGKVLASNDSVNAADSVVRTSKDTTCASRGTSRSGGTSRGRGSERSEDPARSTRRPNPLTKMPNPLTKRHQPLSPGGPTLSPKGPVVSPGGPTLSPGDPTISLGGPVLSPGGPTLSTGGTLSPGDSVLSRGTPYLSPGGSVISPESPSLSPGGPTISPGDLAVSPRGPDLSPRGPGITPVNFCRQSVVSVTGQEGGVPRHQSAASGGTSAAPATDQNSDGLLGLECELDDDSDLSLTPVPRIIQTVDLSELRAACADDSTVQTMSGAERDVSTEPSPQAGPVLELGESSAQCGPSPSDGSSIQPPRTARKRKLTDRDTPPSPSPVEPAEEPLPSASSRPELDRAPVQPVIEPERGLAEPAELERELAELAELERGLSELAELEQRVDAGTPPLRPAEPSSEPLTSQPEQTSELCEFFESQSPLIPTEPLMSVPLKNATAASKGKVRASNDSVNAADSVVRTSKDTTCASKGTSRSRGTSKGRGSDRSEDPARSPGGPAISPRDPPFSPGGPTLSLRCPTLSPRGTAPSPGGHAISPGFPTSSPGGPAISPQCTTLSPGDPAISPGGPILSQGGPVLSPIGPSLSPGGPNLSTGGTLSPGDSVLSQGTPYLSPGGPVVSPECPALSPGGLALSPGGPTLSPGGPGITPVNCGRQSVVSVTGQEDGVPRHQSAASGGVSAAPATDQNSDGLLGLERELDDDSDLSLTPVPRIIQTVDLSELRAACADGSTVQTMPGTEQNVSAEPSPRAGPALELSESSAQCGPPPSDGSSIQPSRTARKRKLTDRDTPPSPSPVEPAEEPLPSASSRPELDRAPVQPVIGPERGSAEPAELERELAELAELERGLSELAELEQRMDAGTPPLRPAEPSSEPLTSQPEQTSELCEFFESQGPVIPTEPLMSALLKNATAASKGKVCASNNFNAADSAVRTSEGTTRALRGTAGASRDSDRSEGPACSPKDLALSPEFRTLSPGGPVISPGGPILSPRGQAVSTGGPAVSRGGPAISPGGPAISLGGPALSPGDPVISSGGQVISPRLSTEGTLSPGGPAVSPGLPTLSQRGPTPSAGGPVLSPGCPALSPGGPALSPGGPGITPVNFGRQSVVSVAGQEGGLPRHQSAASGGVSAAPATDQNSDGLLGLERELDDDSDLSLTPVPRIIQTVDPSELRAACADDSTVQAMPGTEQNVSAEPSPRAGPALELGESSAQCGPSPSDGSSIQPSRTARKRKLTDRDTPPSPSPVEPAEEPLPSASSRPELDRAPVQPVIEPERGLAEPAELERELAELAELERGLSELAELEQRMDAGTPPLRPAEPSSEPLTSQPEQRSELCEFFESQGPVIPTEPLMSVPLKSVTSPSRDKVRASTNLVNAADSAPRTLRGTARASRGTSRSGGTSRERGSDRSEDPTLPRGPAISPGGPTLSPRGPVVSPGGPTLSPGDPTISLGGPVLSPGGPTLSTGGTLSPGDSVLSRGTPYLSPGGSVISPGDLAVSPRGPDLLPRGPDITPVNFGRQSVVSVAGQEGGLPRHQPAASGGVSAAPATDQNSDGLLGLERELDDDSDLSLTPVPRIIQTVDLSELRAACADDSTVQTMSGAERDVSTEPSPRAGPALELGESSAQCGPPPSDGSSIQPSRTARKRKLTDRDTPPSPSPVEPAEEPLPSASSRPELDRAPVQPVIEPERGSAEPAELERELAELAELERGLSELAELEQRMDAGTPPLRPAEPSSEPLTSQPEQTSELCEFFESQSPVMPTEPLMSVPLKNATAASKGKVRASNDSVNAADSVVRASKDTTCASKGTSRSRGASKGRGSDRSEDPARSPGGPTLSLRCPTLSPRGTVPSPGGYAISPGFPTSSPGGPAISPRCTTLSPGDPAISPGGPILSQGGPVLSPRGPSLSPGGPTLSTGGTLSPGDSVLSQGTPYLSPGGPVVSPECPALSPGGLALLPGGPTISPGDLAVSPRRPDLSPRGPGTTPVNFGRQSVVSVAGQEGGLPRHQPAASGGVSAAPATDRNSDCLLGLEREVDDDSDLSLTPVPGIIQTVDLSELRAECADGSTVHTMSGTEQNVSTEPSPRAGPVLELGESSAQCGPSPSDGSSIQPPRTARKRKLTDRDTPPSPSPVEPAEEPLPSASSRPELDRAPVQPVIEPERGLAEPAELERELAELAELERGLSELAELEQRMDAGTPPLRPAEPSSEPLTSQPEQRSELCEFFESQSPLMPPESGQNGAPTEVARQGHHGGQVNNAHESGPSASLPVPSHTEQRSELSERSESERPPLPVNNDWRSQKAKSARVPQLELWKAAFKSLGESKKAQQRPSSISKQKIVLNKARQLSLQSQSKKNNKMSKSLQSKYSTTVRSGQNRRSHGSPDFDDSLSSLTETDLSCRLPSLE